MGRKANDLAADLVLKTGHHGDRNDHDRQSKGNPENCHIQDGSGDAFSLIPAENDFPGNKELCIHKTFPQK